MIIIALLTCIFAYLNLLVSEKYETQLEGLSSDITELENAKIIKQKIFYYKIVAGTVFIICLGSIYFLLNNKKT
jgi:hypothetical protein